MSKLFTGFLLSVLFTLYAWSCSDDYITYETRIIDAQNKVPVYFWCDARPNYDYANTWYFTIRPDRNLRLLYSSIIL